MKILVFLFQNGKVAREIRPTSGKHGRLLKFFWNLKGQVAHKNKPIFGFQNGQVVRENKSILWKHRRLLNFFLKFEKNRSPVKIY